MLAVPIRPGAPERERYVGIGSHTALLDALNRHDGKAARGAICNIIEGAAGWYRDNYDFGP